MSYSKKIVLHCPHGATQRLDNLVEDFIRDGVIFVAVVGADSAHVEDIIDELVVGDGTRDYQLLTSSHADESISAAVRFVQSLTGEFAGSEVQVVNLLP
jgi:hypothetical protein